MCRRRRPGLRRHPGRRPQVQAPEDVATYEGPAPDWFTQGGEAALLAPTAFGKQSFTLTGKDGQVTIRCAEGDYADQDRGIVKYHFEVGAGPDSFT